MDGEDITDRLREPQVERGVSLVSKIPGVRSVMVRQQQSIAKEGAIVMAGRDIGTVVLKDANVKVFLKAPLEVRARRRFHELGADRQSASYQEVMDNLVRRDKIDSERSDSPLRPAEDAIQIETDNLQIAEVAERILAIVDRH